MNTIDRLIEKFREFPGIGPRQAKRFVYFLLFKNRSYLDELSTLILEVKKEVHVCAQCFRFFYQKNPISTCSICSSSNRDTTQLMIVEKDIDLESIERSGAYQGKYFVFGGTVPILEKEPERKVRSRELVDHVQTRLSQNPLKEIIIAFAVNAEGENTALYIKNILRDIALQHHITFTTLGRGLSTGLEVEYSDSETLKNALRNRATLA